MAMPASHPLIAPPADIERLYAAHAAATSYYRAQLHRNHGPVHYLRDRGLGIVVDREPPWRIGFAPRTWTALVDHLRGHGFTDAELLRGGLAFRSRERKVLDLFRDRIMFPIRDVDGRTVGFTARIWHPASAGDPDQPKYLNSPDTPIYDKGRLLFGLAEQHDRIAAGHPPVIVEGPTDALAIWAAYTSATRTGLVALATCGTAISPTQLDIATSLPGAQRYGLAAAFDGDDAGHKAAERTHALLTAEHPDVNARGIRFAAGADPGDLAAQPDGRARLRATLQRDAQPLLHLIVDQRIDTMLAQRPQLLREIESRIQLGRWLAPLITAHRPDAIAAAVAHVTDAAVARTGSTPEGLRDAADTVRSLTDAIIEHLETAPPTAITARSAPGPPSTPHPAAAAFPDRPLAQGARTTSLATAGSTTRRSPVASRHTC